MREKVFVKNIKTCNPPIPHQKKREKNEHKDCEILGSTLFWPNYHFPNKSFWTLCCARTNKISKRQSEQPWLNGRSRHYSYSFVGGGILTCLRNSLIYSALYVVVVVGGRVLMLSISHAVLLARSSATVWSMPGGQQQVCTRFPCKGGQQGERENGDKACC